MHVLGDLDELNTILGVVLAESALPVALSAPVQRVQRELFIAGADIAAPEKAGAGVPRISPVHIGEIEQWGTELERELPELQRFILPGGSRAAALLHQARAVCRRAERWLAALSREEHVNTHVQVYLNRLSDALFLAARWANRAHGISETLV